MIQFSKILLFTASLFVISACAPEEFDTEYYLSENGMFDSNLIECITRNHSINSIEDLEKIKSLSCHYMDIQTLTGIELLKGVEVLHFSGNDLANVNLPEIKALLRIKINDEFGIDEINLSGQPNLELIDLNDISVNSIHIENNPLLRVLYLDDSYTGTVDILGENKVKYITFENIYCSDLNIDGMQEVTNILFPGSTIHKANIANLETVKIITSGVNSSIKEITLENLPLLLGAYLQQSDLQILNILELPSLSETNLDDNQIVDLHFDETNFVLGYGFLRKTIFIERNPLSDTTKSFLDSLTEINVSY